MSQITDKNFVIVIGGVQHQMQSRADKSEALNPSYASQSEGLKLKLLLVLSSLPTPNLPSLHIFLSEALSYTYS